MTGLSVNVNKLATLRNSRGKNTPDVVELSRKIISYGVFGLTVHPRPDGRHIRHQDVLDLDKLIKNENARLNKTLEYNIEGYPSDDFIELVEQVSANQATLVPDPPDALTSNAGWDVVKHKDFLRLVVERLQTPKRRVSLFIDPFSYSAEALKALKEISCARIELYTEQFADSFAEADRGGEAAKANLQKVTAQYARVAKEIYDSGIGLNAGHDLNQKNLKYLVNAIPELAEVSIGHALICESLESGLETTVRNYLKILDN